MTQLIYHNESIELVSDESVLDVLTRHGHAIPHGCRSGVCQSCLMVAEQGDIPLEAQKGLSLAQQKLNYFLSCQCKPKTSLSVRLPNTGAFTVAGEVIEKKLMTSNIVRLRLQAKLDYQPGQYVNLWRDEVLGRSYSLASLPSQDDFLEFHIKLAEKGQFSAWLKHEVEQGTAMRVQGPMGHCIFTAHPDQPLLLAGIGTGLAPLYGIVRQALIDGHDMPIHLLVAARTKAGFYLVDELAALADQHANLKLHFVCQEAVSEFAVQADVYQYSKTHFGQLKNWRVFLCGAESFVRKMRKHCFLAGAAMADISADSFIASN